MADTTHVGGNPIRSGTAEKWLRNCGRVQGRTGGLRATGQGWPVSMQAQIKAVLQAMASRRRKASRSDSAGAVPRGPGCTEIRDRPPLPPTKSPQG